MSFSIQVSTMMDQATDMRIGLVVSFDKRDDLTWTFWSCAPNARVVPEGLTANPFTRASRTFAPGGMYTDAVVLPDSLGFHAEELFILCCDSMLQVARTRTGNIAYTPHTVWLVLSKSCCTGQSGSSPLTIGGVLYPHSCSSKLRDFIGRMPQIARWKIRYFNLAGSKAASSDQVRHNAAAHPATGLEALRAKREQIDADFEVKFREWEKYVPKKYEHAGANKPGLVKGFLRTQRADALVKNDVAMNALRNTMRSLSVAQAQQGIAELEKIAKVDICRVLTNPVLGTMPEVSTYWT